MSIEDEVFKKEKLNVNKLQEYGFKKDDNRYGYSKKFMNNSFRADIYIDVNGNVTGKVFDLDSEEEYTNFRIEDVVGEFVNTIKEEYIKILKDIASKCFEKQYFIKKQIQKIYQL